MQVMLWLCAWAVGAVGTGDGNNVGKAQGSPRVLEGLARTQPLWARLMATSLVLQLCFEPCCAQCQGRAAAGAQRAAHVCHAGLQDGAALCGNFLAVSLGVALAGLRMQ